MKRLRPGGRLIHPAAVALAVVSAVGPPAGEARTLTGRVLGLDGADGVWVGVPGAGEWTFSENGNFELPVSGADPTTVVAVARDRRPQVAGVNPGASADRLELRLAAGFAVNGTVLSGNGLALPGATVTVAPVGLGGFEVPAFARPKWTAAADGTFRIGGLETGRYLVEAEAEGHIPVVLEDVLFQDGDPAGLELRLPRGVFVAGRVVDADGAPVPGIEVGARWLAPKRIPVQRNGVIGAELSDRFVSRGHAAVNTAADGSYRHGPFEAATAVNVFAKPSDLGTARRREVSAPYDDLVLRLHRETVRGVVQDAGGRPIENFVLSTHSGPRGKHVVRDADGRFAVPVHADTNVVNIDASGYFPWFGRLFTASGGEYDLGRVVLERARTVTGRVRDARSGTPVAGAVLRRSPRQYDDVHLRVFTGNWFGHRHAARTDERGEFALGKLPPHADLLEVSLVGVGRQQVGLPADVTVFDIDLAFDAVLAGTLALPDGTPAEGLVRLSGPDIPRESEVGGDGSFRWEGLPSGRYRLEADTEEGAVAGHTVVVGDGESVEDIRLVVEPGRRVSGTIAGLVGPERAEVVVRDGDGRNLLRRRFGNGAYVLRGLPRRADVVARTTTGRELARRIRFGGHDEARLDLVFSGTARLTGTVTAGGRPLGGVELRIVPEDRAFPKAYATTTDTGRYAVQGLSLGRHVVRTRTGYSFDVEVAARTAFDVELPPVSLSGTVRAEETGLPVGGGRVRLKRGESTDGPRVPVLGSRTASDGSFAFDGLVRGAYVVRVSHPDFGDVSRHVRISGIEEIEFRLAGSR